MSNNKPVFVEVIPETTAESSDFTNINVTGIMTNTAHT